MIHQKLDPGPQKILQDLTKDVLEALQACDMGDYQAIQGILDGKALAAASEYLKPGCEEELGTLKFDPIEVI